MLKDDLNKSRNTGRQQNNDNAAARTWSKLPRIQIGQGGTGSQSSTGSPQSTPGATPPASPVVTSAWHGILANELAAASATGYEWQSSTEAPTQPAGAQCDQVLAEAAAPLPGEIHEMSGRVINGNYRIETLLAEGGMGQVFLATHLKREIPVVLKLMRKDADPEDKSFQRFVAECKITTRLTHPNLVLVLDWGILIGSLKPYLVIEYVEGKSLRQIQQEGKTLSPYETACLLTQVCSGLTEVHSRQIIHRDLKPENIMVRGDLLRPDNVKILDFGIAQLQQGANAAEAGLAVGSVGYMSPEQICAQPVDCRTDIYSLGVIFYELITGLPPFVGNSVREAMEKHVLEALTLPSQVAQIEDHAWVDRIAQRSMAKTPRNRYQSAAEMQKDLQFLIELGSG